LRRFDIEEGWFSGEVGKPGAFRQQRPECPHHARREPDECMRLDCAARCLYCISRLAEGLRVRWLWHKDEQPLRRDASGDQSPDVLRGFCRLARPRNAFQKRRTLVQNLFIHRVYIIPRKPRI
jgi:hypothetical protein